MHKRLFDGMVLPSTEHPVAEKRDSELEQAGIRVLIGLVALFYFSWTGFPAGVDDVGIHLDPIWVLVGFVTVAAVVMFWVLLRRGDKPPRRIISIVLDVGTLTYLLLISESKAAPLFFLYQWIIVGYGFRFGVRYLFITLGLSLLGFGGVIVLVPYWRDELSLSLGLWMGTLLISLYFSTLVSRLCKALNHAEEANRAKRKFICSVSHELRTPLNAIIGMIDLMKSTPLDREQREIVDSMTTTSKVMLSQIEDVLDFSKIEAGKMSVERIPFDLYQLVQGILDIFAYQLDPFQIELSHNIDSAAPYLLEGDPHHLRQILVNLLGNAVKFTEQGRISLSIRKIDSPDERVRLNFLIRDTGIGISEAAQARIFDSFTQADESTARRFGGTGLGTTICKQLVELMNGRIGFSSRQGEGTAFWFELDFYQPAPVFPEDVHETFEAVRALVIGSHAETEPLVERLVCAGAVAPALALTDDAAAAVMEQAVLVGTPIRLAFIRHMYRDDQLPADDAAAIRRRIDHLRKTAPHGKLTAVLVTEDAQLGAQLEEFLDVAGLYSILYTPVMPECLLNILHAHLIELKRSKTLVVSAEEPQKALSEPGSVIPANDDDGYEILIAEDNPTNRKVLQKILERAGHRCAVVKDGDEALDAVEKKAFDAMVLDMNMPSMAGTDVARLCRLMHGQSARIPIIMFSANVTADARRESLKAGADEFLPKPIQVDAFLATLERLVEGSRLASPVPRKHKASAPQVPLLSRENEPSLNVQSLEDIEQMSKDPTFLDDLIGEFVAESRKLLILLERSILEGDQERFREIIHALKGSALSIGAVSMKMACKRLEKLDPLMIENHPDDIMRQLNQIFVLLCEDLEKYRQKRCQRSYEARG